MYRRFRRWLYRTFGIDWWHYSPDDPCTRQSWITKRTQRLYGPAGGYGGPTWADRAASEPANLEELSQVLAALGVTDGEIDSLVTDCALNDAANVNNGGRYEQLEYLVADLGSEDAVATEFKSRKGLPIHE